MVKVVSSDTAFVPQVVVGTVWLPLESLRYANLFASKMPALTALREALNAEHQLTRFFYGTAIVRDGMYSWVRQGHPYSCCSNNGRVFAFLYNVGGEVCVDVCVLRAAGIRPIIDRLAKLTLSETPLSILIRTQSSTRMGVAISSLPGITFTSIVDVEITATTAQIFI